jgi:hypothetical protein
MPSLGLPRQSAWANRPLRTGFGLFFDLPWLMTYWGFWALWAIVKNFCIGLYMLINWLVTVAIPFTVAAYHRRQASRLESTGTPSGPRDWSPPEESSARPGSDSGSRSA